MRKRRAALLREAGAVRRAGWLASLVGTTQAVLVERPGDRGHAGNFAEVRFDKQPVGTIHHLIIDRVEDNLLIATPRHPRESGDPASSSLAVLQEQLDLRFRGDDVMAEAAA